MQVDRSKDEVARHRSLLETAALAAVMMGLLTMGCASPPKRLCRGVHSQDVRLRRESVVRLRAYSSASPGARARTRELLVEALDDGDMEVRRLAGIGLIEHKEDPETRGALEAALQRAETPQERATLADVLARFR